MFYAGVTKRERDMVLNFICLTSFNFHAIHWSYSLENALADRIWAQERVPFVIAFGALTPALGRCSSAVKNRRQSLLLRKGTNYKSYHDDADSKLLACHSVPVYKLGPGRHLWTGACRRSVKNYVVELREGTDQSG